MESTSITGEVDQSVTNLQDRAERRSIYRAAVLVFLLSLAMHVPFLGMTPIAGTEGHRIFPAHEMVRSGWWAVPVLFGHPFLTKPPLHMWLIAAEETLAGRGNVFVWRLPSAVAGAVLGAAMSLFGGRWFGRVAGVIAGIGCAGMITLWGQSQVSDIDSTNTLAAAVTALCVVVLHVERPGRVWPWIVGAGLALGATLMTKGPGGLPVVVGALVWGIVLAVREREPVRVVQPRFWMPLVIGAAIFAGYFFYARASLGRHHLPPDFRGVQEGTSRLYADSLKTLGKSLAVIPGQLFAFAIPVSLALVLYCVPSVRREVGPRDRRLATALVAAVLIGWGVCVASGMDNPRYGYPTLLPLCPLAGAAALAAARSVSGAKWLKAAAVFSGVGYAAAACLLSFSTWRISHSRMLLAVLVCASVVAIMLAVVLAARIARSWSAAWGFVPLILVVALPFGIQRSVDRSITSGINTAYKLREITGPGAPVAVGGAVTSKPETFYYADVRIEFFPSAASFMPDHVPHGVWVVLDQGEYKRWLRQPGLRLERQQWLCRNGATDYYVAWYPGWNGGSCTRTNGRARLLPSRVV